ncbi:MAG: hypothetical protein JRH20_09085 [Deltaproteobacteria bacterium]|nr:hypothetical protein [Deltaproteobacteria bacterium]
MKPHHNEESERYGLWTECRAFAEEVERHWDSDGHVAALARNLVCRFLNLDQRFCSDGDRIRNPVKPLD